jgi:hypothetical protein
MLQYSIAIKMVQLKLRTSFKDVWLEGTYLVGDLERGGGDWGETGGPNFLILKGGGFEKIYQFEKTVVLKM